MVLTRGANQIASGLVVTFLGIGLTALFGQDYVGQGVNAFASVPIPVLSDIPFLGPILFDHDPLTYLSILSGPLAWLALYRTRFGLMVRAAGERPEVLARLRHVGDVDPLHRNTRSAAPLPASAVRSCRPPSR